MAKVLDQAGMEHLISRLDERYGVDAYISDATVNSILLGRYTPEERSSSSGAFDPFDDRPDRANSNAHEPKSTRVLNYPGLMHLIPRLDKRYMPANTTVFVDRITNTELEEMLV